MGSVAQPLLAWMYQKASLILIVADFSGIYRVCWFKYRFLAFEHLYLQYCITVWTTCFPGVVSSISNVDLFSFFWCLIRHISPPQWIHERVLDLPLMDFQHASVEIFLILIRLLHEPWHNYNDSKSDHAGSGINKQSPRSAESCLHSIVVQVMAQDALTCALLEL